MESTKQQATETFSKTKKYFELQKERLQLELADRFSTAVSETMFVMALGMFLFTCTILVCTTIGFTVAWLTDNWLLGIVTTTTSFLFALLVFILMGKKWIQDITVRTTLNLIS